MVFQISRTYQDPAQGANLNRGFPAPGAGAQTVGPGQAQPPPVNPSPVRWAKGRRTFFKPAAGSNANRGFPSPLNGAQARPPGTMDNFGYAASGLPVNTVTPPYSRGAARTVTDFGKVLTNPIGAGIAVNHRIQAQNTRPGQYVNGAIWWTSQAIPTSVNLQGLNDPAALAAVLGPINVQGVIRTTG